MSELKLRPPKGRLRGKFGSDPLKFGVCAYIAAQVKRRRDRGVRHPEIPRQRRSHILQARSAEIQSLVRKARFIIEGTLHVSASIRNLARAGATMGREMHEPIREKR